jgi:hypothetical protein
MNGEWSWGEKTVGTPSRKTLSIRLEKLDLAIFGKWERASPPRSAPRRVPVQFSRHSFQNMMR